MVTRYIIFETKNYLLGMTLLDIMYYIALTGLVSFMILTYATWNWLRILVFGLPFLYLIPFIDNKENKGLLK